MAFPKSFLSTITEHILSAEAISIKWDIMELPTKTRMNCKDCLWPITGIPPPHGKR
jgi:hypothetical protein